MKQLPTVALTIAPHGIDCRLVLDGVDISRYVRGVTIRADVNTLTEISVRLLAGCTIDGTPGRLIVDGTPIADAIAPSPPTGGPDDV